MSRKGSNTLDIERNLLDELDHAKDLHQKSE